MLLQQRMFFQKLQFLTSQPVSLKKPTSNTLVFLNNYLCVASQICRRSELCWENGEETLILNLKFKCMQILQRVDKMSSRSSVITVIMSFIVTCSSTDSQLKLWNVNKPHCLRSFKGHINEKNFVGLASNGDYVACGRRLLFRMSY